MYIDDFGIILNIENSIKLVCKDVNLGDVKKEKKMF